MNNLLRSKIYSLFSISPLAWLVMLVTPILMIGIFSRRAKAQQPVASVLAKAVVYFHTDEYEKAPMTEINVLLVTSSGDVIARAEAVDGNVEYRVESDHSVQLKPISTNISKTSLKKPLLRISTRQQGHDLWSFDCTAVLYFSDGTLHFLHIYHGLVTVDKSASSTSPEWK